jgi:hypothetical protein
MFLRPCFLFSKPRRSVEEYVTSWLELLLDGVLEGTFTQVG